MIVKGNILLIVIREKRLCNFGWYNEFSPVSDCSRAEGGHWTEQNEGSGWSESVTAQSAPCRAKVLSNAKNGFERQGTAKIK